MPHIPILSNTVRYNFLLIGGGDVSARRVKTLLQAGVEITISDQLDQDFSFLEEISHGDNQR